jgi:uncharacterized protein (DUF1810 family)
MSRQYAINSVAEAHAYLAHPIMGPRLLAWTEAMLAIEGRAVSEVFGYPDNLKLNSYMTLFAYVAGADSLFEQVLAKYFNGERGIKTIQLLEKAV